MATILCAGGAGYIGTHTCIALLQAGHKVIVADVCPTVKRQLWIVCNRLQDRRFLFIK